MAPRKSKAKAPAATPPVQSGKVAKPKSKATKGKAKSNAAPAVPPASTHGVKLYRDGLVNLERTPAHLVDIVKHNALNSPLLRLPRELRDQIWSFAMGGQLVYLPWHAESRGYAVRPEFQADVYSFHIYGFKAEAYILPAAFHLPEVCRQIYSEAAMIAYQQNIFMIDDYFLGHSKAFHSFTRAQRGAITGIMTDRYLFISFMCRESSGQVKVAKRMMGALPNLSYILVTALDSKIGLEQYNLHSRKSGPIIGEAEWETKVQRQYKFLFGDKVRVKIEK
ncbi:hypothetical protein E8E13_007228 [Curvularia kusanoi]|uniref:DUF7730 domain-containing protein n=1 Tax=Curvularia kusanoi TaxID=90978 RepID=A0A9P4W6E8_CURKU|nr:hypothetical protein E8E13_007228 [Curvularia kusanoi]